MRDPAAGFTLVEVLIATAITAGVTALACGLVLAEQTVWRADSARVDLQQRARVAADSITRALLEAGAGPQRGPSRGALLRVAAPVLPRRIGARRADAADAVRTDAISVLSTRSDIEHGVLLTPAVSGTAVLEISPAPACALASCGFSAGQMLMLHDWTGNFDLFVVTGALGQAVAVRQLGAGAGVGYAAGSAVIGVESWTFYLDATAAALRRYDGDASDVPLLDDVVGMEVEYHGNPQPPRWPRPAAGVANCLYAADGTFNAVLMPALTAGVTLVPLPPDVLSDGPWCGSGANQFDADLLRLRRVRVVLRLQAADPAVRGTDPVTFSRPGTAHRSASMVADVTVDITVAPRNLRQGW